MDTKLWFNVFKVSASKIQAVLDDAQTFRHYPDTLICIHFNRLECLHVFQLTMISFATYILLKNDIWPFNSNFESTIIIVIKKTRLNKIDITYIFPLHM